MCGDLQALPNLSVCGFCVCINQVTQHALNDRLLHGTRKHAIAHPWYLMLEDAVARLKMQGPLVPLGQPSQSIKSSFHYHGTLCRDPPPRASAYFHITLPSWEGLKRRRGSVTNGDGINYSFYSLPAKSWLPKIVHRWQLICSTPLGNMTTHYDILRTNGHEKVWHWLFKRAISSPLLVQEAEGGVGEGEEDEVEGYGTRQVAADSGGVVELERVDDAVIRGTADQYHHARLTEEEAG